MVQRVHHTVKKSFLENGKLNRFIVARILQPKTFDKHETGKSKRNKRWEEVVTYQQ
jgi:hypothetical protein